MTEVQLNANWATDVLLSRPSILTSPHCLPHWWRPPAHLSSHSSLPFNKETFAIPSKILFKIPSKMLHRHYPKSHRYYYHIIYYIIEIQDINIQMLSSVAIFWFSLPPFPPPTSPHLHARISAQIDRCYWVHPALPNRRQFPPISPSLFPRDRPRSDALMAAIQRQQQTTFNYQRQLSLITAHEYSLLTGNNHPWKWMVTQPSSWWWSAAEDGRESRSILRRIVRNPPAADLPPPPHSSRDAAVCIEDAINQLTG